MMHKILCSRCSITEARLAIILSVTNVSSVYSNLSRRLLICHAAPNLHSSKLNWFSIGFSNP